MDIKNITLKKVLKRIKIGLDSNIYFYKIKDHVFFYNVQNKLNISRKTYNKLKVSDIDYLGLNSCKFDNHTIKFTSAYWFLHSINEIFVEEVYKFLSEKREPFIVDCGANIGLSILYFKKLNKNSKILAFEADPRVFKQLEANIAEYKYDDVQLINAAVWDSETKISFFSEGTVGGRMSVNDDDDRSVVEIPTIRLRDYFLTEIDFLKIDIEGAEYQVLKDCADVLVNVKNLFIEYHVKPDEEQHLHEILTWINNNNFKYYIKEASKNMNHPFLKIFDNYYQMQLNIFCYR